MTSSSGPGFSLKQEAISYLCTNFLPALFVNVIRWGPGLGNLDSAQTDYLRDTRGGGNGDYRLVVLAPNSIQETVDLLYDAYDIAERYRNPVELLSEAALGQMMEPVEFPEFKEGPTDLDWVWDGTGDKNSYDHGRPTTAGKPAAFRKKIETMRENEQRWENYKVQDADYVFVSYGLPSRTTRTAVDKLRAEGEKVGLIRPITACDISALADLIVTVSNYAFEHRDEIKEMDLNPVLVYPEGVCAVDALIVKYKN